MLLVYKKRFPITIWVLRRYLLLILQCYIYKITIHNCPVYYYSDCYSPINSTSNSINAVKYVYLVVINKYLY